MISGELAKSPPPISHELTDLSDQMLGEFRLIRKLGAGGMAEVYLAEQTTLRRQVAVKILRPQFFTDEHYVKRFRHEAAAAGSLSHPNIVQVYLVGEDRGTNYIAQEYVQGRNLKDYITRKGPLEVKIALRILRQVASALQVASENGIVHRDIKPENILLTNKAEAKVADFGLAQLTFQGERVSLTQTGLTLGTPLYMSPEQVNGLPLDSRSDIYSFGIMAWHMLAGRPPFVGETAIAVAVKHLNDKPPALTEFRQDIPPSLRDLIMRMISKKNEDRPDDFSPKTEIFCEIFKVSLRPTLPTHITIYHDEEDHLLLQYHRGSGHTYGWPRPQGSLTDKFSAPKSSESSERLSGRKKGAKIQRSNEYAAATVLERVNSQHAYTHCLPSSAGRGESLCSAPLQEPGLARRKF